jgi:hypothetical protein
VASQKIDGNTEGRKMPCGSARISEFRWSGRVTIIQGRSHERRKMQKWLLVLEWRYHRSIDSGLRSPEVSAATPCCNITAIDTKTGIVTAKDTATGETIKFRLGDAAQVKNIKIGDPVSADSQTREVTVHSFQPVGGILIKKPMPRPPIVNLP